MAAFIPAPLLTHSHATDRLKNRRTNRIRPHALPNRLPPRAEISQQDPDKTLIPEADALTSPDTVIIPGSFNLAAVFMLSSGIFLYLGDAYILPGFPLLLVGLLLSIQSFRIRFIFGPKRLSVAMKTGKGLKIIRGWGYEEFVNWEVWWKFWPVLAYFKEAESYEGRGSIHFFPVLCDGQMLISELRSRTPHIPKPEYE